MSTLLKKRVDVEGAREAPALEGRRIALFSGNYNYTRDGANQALNRLVAHLEGDGATVRVYSPTGAKPAFEPQGTLISVPSIAFPGRGEYRLALGLPKSIREDLRRFDPELVHLSAPDWLGSRALAWARHEQRVPVIASLHTRFERYLESYGLGLFRPVMEAYLRRFYGRCDLVLVPNRPIFDEMAQDHAGKLGIWSRGVDRDLFNPARRSGAWRRARGFQDTEVVLLFFGRLVVEKGTKHFAEIVCKLRALGIPARVLIVGDGPARERLRSDVGDAHFTGHLSGEDLATAIASADIMINPSLSEAFGNVNLEGLASGLTVVAADCDSARNLIVHGANGWLCTASPQNWAEDIAQLIESPFKRVALGNAATRSAASHDWRSVMGEVKSAYANLLSTGGLR